MKDTGRLIWLLTGLCLGVAGAGIYALGQPRTVCPPAVKSYATL